MVSMLFSCLLLDLDDTLAPEWDYVVGGYRAAARVLADAAGGDAAAVLNRFVYEHMKYGRHRIMDRIVAQYGVDADLVPALVRAYREHAPCMHLYPGVETALRRLSAGGARIAVVTDGAAGVQRGKVRSLNLERFVDSVIYCAECNAPKPDPTGYRTAMESLGATPDETLVVGDDPFCDLGAAAALGVAACRVRTGRYGKVACDAWPVLQDLPTFADAALWIAGRGG